MGSSVVLARQSDIVMIEGRYVYDVQLTAGQALAQQRQAIDNDSDFILRGISASSHGTFKVRFSDGAGYYYSTDFINSAFFTAITGLLSPYSFNPQELFKAGQYIGIDITDTSNAANAVQIVFWGVRRYIPVDRAIRVATEKN